MENRTTREVLSIPSQLSSRFDVACVPNFLRILKRKTSHFRMNLANLSSYFPIVYVCGCVAVADSFFACC